MTSSKYCGTVGKLPEADIPLSSELLNNRFADLYAYLAERYAN